MNLGGKRFVLLTMPVPRPLSDGVPQLEQSQLDSMPGEYDRIPRYQQDTENEGKVVYPHRVATLDEAMEYDDWLHAQPALSSLF